ncbi:serine--tRNA ligase, partial [Candidatus Pelagibacter sp.]|nr:serine--tRNA ligase [Candidatus Pelagibacter sp.]
MHNLKEIRKNFSEFAKSLEKRSVNVDFANLEKLDELNRELIQKKESLENEKKEISKSKDESLFKKSKEISIELEKISENQKKTKIKLDEILSNIPNIPNFDVPDGKDENDNVEVLKSGKITEFDFETKSHYELGENLRMLDFDLATKTTGSRFVFVKDKLALLERALSNFMLDIHVTQNKYQEISPPLIASDNTMFGTGQLP